MSTDYLLPMLCGTLDELPQTPGWIMECKLDGWRFLFGREDGEVFAYGGRNGAEYTHKPGVRPLREAFAKLLPPGTIVDTELVADGDGKISSDVASALARGGKLTAFVFDVVQLMGRDVRHLPYSDRRKLLERLFEGMDIESVRLNLSVPVDRELFESWLAVGLEGVVCKRTNSTYRSGKRSRDWMKLKPTKSIDCTIIELPRDGRGKFAGQVGSVVFDIGNGKRGRASGMTDAVRMDMTVNPAKYIGRTAEFSYQLQTRGGHLRHPQWVRLRPDRDAA